MSFSRKFFRIVACSVCLAILFTASAFAGTTERYAKFYKYRHNFFRYLKGALLITTQCWGQTSTETEDDYVQSPVFEKLRKRNHSNNYSYGNGVVLYAVDFGNSDVQYAAVLSYPNAEGIRKVNQSDGEAPAGTNLSAKELIALALKYANGDGVAKDSAAAFKYIFQAAALGNADAQFVTGGLYLNGEGVSKNEAEGVKWLLKAAQQGQSNAQYYLAVCYYKGIGVQQNMDEGKKWAVMSAKQGNEKAEKLLNETEARSGKQSDGEANLSAEELIALAKKYFSGYGVAKDEATAFKYFLQAASLGNAEAQCMSGVLYMLGKGVSKNETEGAKWLLKAAQQGHSEAQCDLAICYYNGIGVQQNLNEAARLLSEAKKQGNKRAGEIAMMIVLGQGLDMIFPSGRTPVNNNGASAGAAGDNRNICPRCHGTGVCPECGGRGGTTSILFGVYECHACQHTGLCYTCRGAGVLR